MIPHKEREHIAAHAAIVRNMNFYQCSWNDALGYIPPAWAVYRDRYGHNCPSEERYNRIRSGRDPVYLR